MGKISAEAEKMMIERFGKDTVIALATVEHEVPHVRKVNAYYENGSFYIITYALSNKIKQIWKCSKKDALKEKINFIKKLKKIEK